MPKYSIKTITLPDNATTVVEMPEGATPFISPDGTRALVIELVTDGAVQRGRLPENEPQRHPKPRVSSISRDAREIAYMMANTPISTPSRGDLSLSAEQGRMMEDVSIEALEERGLYVVNRQIQLPDSYPFTGHPDGELSTARSGGLSTSTLAAGPTRTS